MDDETARALNALNVAFYTRHAADFSAKRTRPWKGWTRVVRWLPERPTAVLDIGCGNGRFGRFLARERRLSRYTGVDVSRPLLEIARGHPPEADHVDWRERDLVASPPADALPRDAYDLVVLFGVLHGIPGEARRRALLEAAAHALAPGGLLVFTCWRFAEDERISRRTVPPDTLLPPIDPRRLEPGDRVLPWGDGGDAHRYVADVDAAQRRRLVRGLGLSPVDEFFEDGPVGDLNHYSVARVAPG